MQPQVRLKTSLNYSNWECWNSYLVCRIWGWALAPKAKNIIHVVYIFIYIYILCYEYDFGVNVTTQFSKLQTLIEEVQKWLRIPFQDRHATRCLLLWYLLAMSAISILKTALNLTGTSAQAEEFSVFVFIFSSYTLWFTPLIELCTI